MIKLKNLGLSITEKEYRDLDNVSYSFLSALDRLGPEGALRKVEPTESMIFGTIVDSKIDGSFKICDYHVMRDVQIGDKLKLAIDGLVETLDSFPEKFEDLKDSLIHFLENNQIDYYIKKTSEWRATKIITDPIAVKYYNNIKLGVGKTIVTQNMLMDSDSCVTILKNHQFTKDLFNDNVEGQESIYQFKYKFKYKGIEIKGMLDRLIIDHTNKLIKPYDLKTGSKSALNFENSFYYWRYDIQAFLYLGICNHLIENYYPGYKFDEFKFIYIGRYEKKPLIWSVPMKHIIATGKGYSKDNKSYKGVNELIEDYKWYLKNNFTVSYPEKVYKSNGELKIDVTAIQFD